MKVEVYRNLRRNCWSVRDSYTKRVVVHCKSIGLCNTKLTVQKAGRQKVLDTGQKNVHAFVRGQVILWPIYAGMIDKEFRYNPFVEESFVDVLTGEPIYTAPYVFLNEEGKGYYGGTSNTKEEPLSK